MTELPDEQAELKRVMIYGVTEAPEVVRRLKNSRTDLKIVADLLNEKEIDYRVVNSSIKNGQLVFHFDDGDEVVGELDSDYDQPFQSLVYRTVQGGTHLSIMPWIMNEDGK